jgi:hypothetical protein
MYCETMLIAEGAHASLRVHEPTISEQCPNNGTETTTMMHVFYTETVLHLYADAESVLNSVKGNGALICCARVQMSILEVGQDA